MKIFGKHGNDDGGMVAEDDGLADDFGLAAETLLPGGIAEHDGVWRGEQIFTGIKITAENGIDAEDAEKTIADAGAGNGLGAGRSVERELRTVVDLQRSERFSELFPIEIIGIGKIAIEALVSLFIDAEGLLRVFVGNRFEERAVNESEDGHADAEAERDHEDGGEREAEIFS